MAAERDARHVALAATVALGVLSAICCILRARGVWIQLMAVVFVLSLVSTQLLMSKLAHAYESQAFVTSLHFLCMWALSFAHFGLAGEPEKCSPLPLGKRYLLQILPVSFSLPLSVAFNNQALLFMGAGLNAVLGTLSPIATALLSRALGRRFPTAAWGGILLACVGAATMVRGELVRAGSGSAVLGLTFGAGAVLLRSVKVVLLDRLLQPEAYSEEARPLDSMHAWALQAPPSFLVSVTYASLTDSATQAWQGLRGKAVSLIALSCASATLLNILGMLTIKHLGANSMQIIGKLNTVITLACSAALLGESVSLRVLLGTALVLAGVAWFERAQAKGNNHAAQFSTVKPVEARKLGRTMPSLEGGSSPCHDDAGSGDELKAGEERR